MAARIPFAARVSLSRAARMRVYTRMMPDMGINMLSDSMGGMGSAMPEIAQQRGYYKVDQSNQEASN
jgi:hypothetical protein